MSENENSSAYAPAPFPNYAAGSGQRQINYLKTNRSLLKFILLSLVTFGLYGVGVIANIGSEVNIIAGRHDGKNTLNFWFVKLIFEPISISVGQIVLSLFSNPMEYTNRVTTTSMDEFATLATAYFFTTENMRYLFIAGIVAYIAGSCIRFVWFHIICTRLGNELRIRNIGYDFDAKTFWLWYVLCSLFLWIGPFVFYYKLIKASNYINEHFNYNC